MNEPNNRSYYACRAEASRALAERAVNPEIAAIHTELATRYEALVIETQRTDMLMAAFRRPDAGDGADNFHRSPQFSRA